MVFWLRNNPLFYASYYNSEVFLGLQTNVILTDSKLNPLHSAFLYPPLLKCPRKTPLHLQSVGPCPQETLISIPKRKTSHLSMTGLLSLHPLLLTLRDRCLSLVSKFCNTHSIDWWAVAEPLWKGPGRETRHSQPYLPLGGREQWPKVVGRPLP